MYDLAMDQGLHEEAAAIAEEMLPGIRSHHDSDPTDMRFVRNLATVLDKRGNARMGLGDLAGRAADFAEGLALSRRLAANDPASVAAQHDLMTALHRFADLLHRQRDRQGATDHLEEAIKLAREWLPRAQDTRVRKSLGICLDRIGSIRFELGQHAAALAAFMEQVELMRSIAVVDGEHGLAKKDLAVALHRVGEAHRATNDFAGSLPFFAESLAIRREFLARDPAPARGMVAAEMLKTGDAHGVRGNVGECVRLFEAALELYRGKLVEQPGSPACRLDVGIALRRLGIAHTATGNWQAGFRSLFEALACFDSARSDAAALSRGSERRGEARGRRLGSSRRAAGGEQWLPGCLRAPRRALVAAPWGDGEEGRRRLPPGGDAGCCFRARGDRGRPARPAPRQVPAAFAGEGR